VTCSLAVCTLLLLAASINRGDLFNGKQECMVRVTENPQHADACATSKLYFGPSSTRCTQVRCHVDCCQSLLSVPRSIQSAKGCYIDTTLLESQQKAHWAQHCEASNSSGKAVIPNTEFGALVRDRCGRMQCTHRVSCHRSVLQAHRYAACVLARTARPATFLAGAGYKCGQEEPLGTPLTASRVGYSQGLTALRIRMGIWAPAPLPSAV
jgi:hypothetical protein